MPADESTAEVSRLLEQWDAINRSPLQLSAILTADSVVDMRSANGDTHLVAVLARLLSCILIRAVMVLLFHFQFGFGQFFTENRSFGFSWFRFLHEICKVCKMKYVKQTINCKRNTLENRANLGLYSLYVVGEQQLSTVAVKSM